MELSIQERLKDLRVERGLDFFIMAILECKFYYRQSWIIEFVNLQLSKSNSPIIS